MDLHAAAPPSSNESRQHLLFIHFLLDASQGLTWLNFMWLHTCDKIFSMYACATLAGATLTSDCKMT